jgi:hypothetical protein
MNHPGDNFPWDADENRVLLERLVQSGFGVRSAVTHDAVGFSPTLKGMQILGMIADINRELPGLTPGQILCLFALAGYRPPNVSQ